VIGGAATLGGASGRTLQLNNWGPALLAAVYVQFVATATVGNRLPTMSVKDPAGNIFWGSETPAAVAASTTIRFAFGAGIQTAAPVASGFFTAVSLADQMVLPPGSQLTFFDSAAIDSNDNVALFNALLSIGS
jgi:hypothetical protein